MARTHGHGNPAWTKDETILALALYLECGEAVPSKKHPRVQQLSSTLRDLPYHAEAARQKTFRNPDGVAFKLQNLRSVATGKGLSNTSAMDREIWGTLGTFPERVRELATAIEKAIALEHQSTVRIEEDHDSKEEFFEGRQLTLTHKRRERHPGVRKALLSARKKNGATLSCDLCRTVSPVQSQGLDDAIFEAHHLLPISQALERKTMVKDMALVCASCHRLIHRVMIDHQRWLTLEEVGQSLKSEILLTYVETS
jgi:5-methylcytosine-specific restriction protein A